MRKMNGNILITGGRGFIGSNLAKALILQKAKVDIFDINNGQNIEDEKELKKFVKKKYDVIYHLAGFSGSVRSNQKPNLCFRINTVPTLKLCSLLLEYSPKTKLILSGSRLEYGKPKYLPVDEEHTINPTSAYGLSKLMCTQAGQFYSNKWKLDITTFRTSNVYGPHPQSKFPGYNVINYFIDLAKRNKEIPVFGKGNQLRDYIYVDDLVNAFILSAQNDTAGKIYNLGYGKGIKFNEMIKLIIKIVGSGKIVFKKWPSEIENVETGSYISSIKKVKRELKFTPAISFEQGIKLTLNKKI